MCPTKKIYLERKAGYGRDKYPVLPSKCIVRCIFNSVGLIKFINYSFIFFFKKVKCGTLPCLYILCN
jgi:hypothetical protein